MTFRPGFSHVVLVASLGALAACSSGRHGFMGDDSGFGTMDSGIQDSSSMNESGTGTDEAGAGDDSSSNLPDGVHGYDTGIIPADAGDCPGMQTGMCTPIDQGCAAEEICGNGLDDNCDGREDEACGCAPGTVQDCFHGPPGAAMVGGCRHGTQRCEGSGEFGTWSECMGGISPTAESCDGEDNDCNGCVDDGLCCNSGLSCPSPGDPRVPDGQPFSDYTLRGELFYTAAARSFHWDVQGGPCDAVLPHPSYTLTGDSSMDAVFHPTLSGDYTVTLTVVTQAGETVQCTFVVHIAGPGLRVELCWDTSDTSDVDLYVHDPSNHGRWFDGTGAVQDEVNNNSCNWSNCEGYIRGFNGRVDWGYARSPLSACRNGPDGSDWRSLGYCANPRLDVDNNLVEGIGVPENVNIDVPNDGQTFRIMAQNFSGTTTHPVFNVYCGGHLRGTLGASPDLVTGFSGPDGNSSIGAMWRAADVTVHVDAQGNTTDCDVVPIHPPGQTSGYYITVNNTSY